METEIEDAKRITGNADVLATVESEIVSLERMFVELASLETEKDRLSTAVRNLTEEESRILADHAAESVIVKKLSETRGRRDVQSARLRSTEDKIKTQTADLKDQGATVRRLFGTICGQLWVARQQRATAILTELFGALWIHSRDGLRMQVSRELTDQTAMMKQLKECDNRVRDPLRDPVAEKAALQEHPRAWLALVTDLVTSEPGFMLKGILARQPIEQPGELAAV